MDLPQQKVTAIQNSVNHSLFTLVKLSALSSPLGGVMSTTRRETHHSEVENSEEASNDLPHVEVLRGRDG